MNVIQAKIEGLLVIEPDIYTDERGYFFESFSREKYKNIGLPSEFKQDNISRSSSGVIRGLHYQIGNSAQGKLCSVFEGTVLDIAVDIRYGSPTYGQYFSQVLSDENKLQLWIPPGFAHGFSVLSESAVFQYKCTQLYNAESERCIRFDDPDLNIDWKVKEPRLSRKDLNGILFKNIDRDFIY
ncbi:MAG: dTDP-4-dehydrorhamnose 3,5-epimerase [Melioribacteraceae bacterium]|nr:dTDP-4-dehydrorhamnose 3,5-epimerase [Melioribacteraceae bacterium]